MMIRVPNQNVTSAWQLVRILFSKHVWVCTHFDKKKVLLRDRKRLIVRGVARARSIVQGVPLSYPAVPLPCPIECSYPVQGRIKPCSVTEITPAPARPMTGPNTPLPRLTRTCKSITSRIVDFHRLIVSSLRLTDQLSIFKKSTNIVKCSDDLLID